MLLNCSRQAGKSTVASIRASHTALFRKRSLTLLVSPSQRQSQELLRKVKLNLDAVRCCRYTTESKSELELANGSRVLSLPATGDTIRGFSAPDLIIEDESSMVEDALHDGAVRPMLAVSKGSTIMLMSSPKGKRGHFYEAWKHGENWERSMVKATDVPRIDPAWLLEQKHELERRGLSELYRQEYECEFIDAAAGHVYDFSDERNIAERLPDSDPRSPWRYILGVDFGTKDDCAFTVIAWREHLRTAYIVESYKHPGWDQVRAAEEAYELNRKYQFSTIVGDPGGGGAGFISACQSRFRIPVRAADKHDKVGYIRLLNASFRTGELLLVPDKCEPLLSEMRVLSWAEGKEKENPSHPNHCTDAMLYAWRACPNYAQAPAPKPLPEQQRIEQEMEDHFREFAEELEYKKNNEWGWLEP